MHPMAERKGTAKRVVAGNGPAIVVRSPGVVVHNCIQFQYRNVVVQHGEWRLRIDVETVVQPVVIDVVHKRRNQKDEDVQGLRKRSKAVLLELMKDSRTLFLLLLLLLLLGD